VRSEDEIQAEIQIFAPNINCTLLRNNSGAAETVEGRQIRFGLGNISKAHNERIKSSDLIGVTTLTITQEMVGMKVGVITAVEVKKEKWKFTATKREIAQLAFIDWMKSRGAYAGFANSIESFKDIFR